FLTPEPLHHWHWEFYDYDTQWCIRAVGVQEIDFQFSILQPITGCWHFKTGISKLKQVTGRVQCELQHYMVVVIVGSVPPGLVQAVQALLNFRYLTQAP
ncbi:hypothetical protein BDR07DRAFT_1245451, partial [Suillus spraguei]